MGPHQGAASMSEVINLRTRRKQAERAAARDQAAVSAARHGEGKAAKTLRQAQAEKAARDLAGHQRDRPSQPE